MITDHVSTVLEALRSELNNKIQAIDLLLDGNGDAPNTQRAATIQRKSYAKGQEILKSLGRSTTGRRRMSAQGRARIAAAARRRWAAIKRSGSGRRTL